MDSEQCGFPSVDVTPISSTDALRAWIMDEAERMPCPPDFIAAAALVALGSVIGARCAIKPKARDNWLIVPNLWGGIVGDPSAKKSPAWGAALKPVDRLIAKALEAHTAALANYETEKVVFDAQRDAIEGRIKEAAKKPSKGDLASIAKELRAHGEQAPDAPTLRRYKTNDSTVEKLGELLRENPTGLLVLRDELVGLIATWEREGREGERAFFLEGWENEGAHSNEALPALGLPRLLPTCEVMRELRRFRYEREFRGARRVPIAGLASICGIDRQSIYTAMMGQEVSPAVKARLSWAIVAIREERLRFTRRGQRWEFEFRKPPDPLPPPQSSLVCDSDFNEWSRCRACGNLRWSPVSMNGSRWHVCMNCLPESQWRAIGASRHVSRSHHQRGWRG